MFDLLRILSNFIVFKLMKFAQDSRIAETISYLIYSTLRIYLLLLIIGFVVGIIRCAVTPEKTRKMLKDQKRGIGNLVAVILAIITPVETFSIVPVFTGLLESGIPAGIAFTYLITAPITNELAFAIFWGLFGYKVAFLYYLCGSIVGLLGGAFIGQLNIEKLILYSIDNPHNHSFLCSRHNLKSILITAFKSSFNFLKSFWLYILIGITMASFMRTFVPKSLILKYVGINNPLAIPLAVFTVILFYVNIAVALPVIMVLVHHGLPLGTILSFTMAITATSLPELLILKRAMHIKLLFLYLSVLISLIVVTGYIINLVLYH